MPVFPDQSFAKYALLYLNTIQPWGFSIQDDAALSCAKKKLLRELHEELKLDAAMWLVRLPPLTPVIPKASGFSDSTVFLLQEDFLLGTPVYSAQFKVLRGTKALELYVPYSIHINVYVLSDDNFIELWLARAIPRKNHFSAADHEDQLVGPCGFLTPSNY